ncbi:hypothetical protein HK097_007489 [Rhizophlyctis rosea]|uniref:Peroxisomal biogenesis factor 11 n=1 Tax=Rhizophlyctis rosea TaxID=64517 RepID=A0AAD5X4K1_9FUNG|nr:hypothetical protein HK097_007489 [Rhizophlyctis rosea]
MTLKPNPTLDKLCRFLGSVRGTDKVLMTVQYTSKIIIWSLRKRYLTSSTALQIQNLATPVSDFRILLRYYGLIPLLQWALISEQNPPPTPRLQLLTRLQNLVNAAYYPLEHAYWLGLHNVIPMSDKTRDKLGVWSCRFWAAYVVLYFAQLWEEHLLLGKREKALGKRVADEGLLEPEKRALLEEKKALVLNTVVNAAYFPLTIHWSLENSTFPDIGVGICGTIAALTQLYGAWQSA